MSRAAAALAAGSAAVGVDVLEPGECVRYATIAADTSWRDAEPLVGPPGRPVWQSFRIATRMPEEVTTLAWSIAEGVNAAVQSLRPAPCPPLTFNELTLQCYPPGGCGISPHRDHRRYRYLALVLVLAGQGRFLVCEDRDGRRARQVGAAPGTLLLMRAPGFAAGNHRPFHAVVDVTRPRMVLGMRFDSALEG